MRIAERHKNERRKTRKIGTRLHQKQPASRNGNPFHTLPQLFSTRHCQLPVLLGEVDEVEVVEVPRTADGQVHTVLTRLKKMHLE
jgi:hypothetical protein